MSISIRPLLVPGVAIATAGVMAMGPTMVAPPVVTLAQPAVQLPVVHVEDIELAGFALDLYNALDGWVQFGLEVAQDLFAWNPGFAAQLSTLYSSLQPIVTAVVTFIDTLTSGPADIIGTLTSLVSNLLPAFGLNLGGLSGLAGLFGLPSLSAAAVGDSAPRAAAARTALGPRAAAAAVAELPAAAEVGAEVSAEAPAPVRANRGAAQRAARTAVVGARKAAFAPAESALAIEEVR